MKYRELLIEYKELLALDVKLRQEMHNIPKGYLVTKKISGKEYLYLQYSVQGKKKSEYVREEDALKIRTAIGRREPLRAEMDTVRAEQIRLETAAKILDTNLYRTLIFLKQCAEMDAMPLEKRASALSFSNAMTALEGLSAKNETEENLRLWVSGQKLFSDFYMKSLQSYNVVEGM